MSINNTAQYGALDQAYSGTNPFANQTFQRLLAKYATLNVSTAAGSVNSMAKPVFGSGYGRDSVFLGDYVFNADRRAASQAWAPRGLPTYSYRFNTVPAGILASGTHRYNEE